MERRWVVAVATSVALTVGCSPTDGCTGTDDEPEQLDGRGPVEVEASRPVGR